MDLVSAYANGVSELTKFSSAEDSLPLIVDVIANPRAGFFKRRSTLWRMLKELERKLEDLRNRFPRRRVEINTVHFTEYAGHARQITEEILAREEKANSGLEHLLIGCGGDGTSNEICTALVDTGGDLLGRLKLLRLPLGTGNDVADAQTFAEAYDLILGKQRTEKTGALLISVNGKRVHYAFNVGSVGLDAFIADLTNRIKRVVPGHAYKALVDVGSLFYEQSVKPLPMNIRIYANGDRISISGIVPSMVVMGISGGRTYGGHMPVLPGRDNVCVVDHMGIWDKIRNKKLFYEGRHGELPEVRFYSAQKVEIDIRGKIPMQLDGELFWLEGEDKTVKMEVLPPAINVLKH